MELHFQLLRKARYFMWTKLTLVASLIVALSPVIYPGPSSASPTTIALPNCLGKPEVKPKDVTLACADANFRVENLQWTGWGETFAAGMGSGTVNDCQPTCVAGHFHNYPMVVIVSGRQTCPGGQLAYAKLTYAFIGRSPFPTNAQSAKNASTTVSCGKP
jgi:hypothetical protein